MKNKGKKVVWDVLFVWASVENCICWGAVEGQS